MGEISAGVGWIGVIVGAIGAFLAGWLWYSPLLFGKKWAADNGLELGTANDMPAVAMVSQFLGLLIVSWFVGVTAVSNLLFTAILALVGFAVLLFSTGSFAKKTLYVRLVDSGYWIVAFVAMIIAQGIF